jgi:hypothetical protein
MKRIRFNIASLLVVVLLVAVCFAGLREASESWDSGLFSLTLVVLMFPILLGVHRTEKRRAYWLGFALFGWTYLGLSLVPSIEPRLITTKALAYLDSKVPDRSTVHLRRVWDTWSNNPTQNNQSILSTSIAFSPQENGAVGGNWSAAGDWMFPRSFSGAGGSSTVNFIRIGHSFLTLIVATLGGLLSRYVYKKNRQVNIGRDTSAAFDLE